MQFFAAPFRVVATNDGRPFAVVGEVTEHTHLAQRVQRGRDGFYALIPNDMPRLLRKLGCEPVGYTRANAVATPF